MWILLLIPAALRDPFASFGKLATNSLKAGQENKSTISGPSLNGGQSGGWRFRGRQM
jgi:hypothetical protein